MTENFINRFVFFVSMKEILKSIIPKRFHPWAQQLAVTFLPDFLLQQESYAQEGEDLVIRRLLGEKKNGFFVDVGANHPVLYSNTYYFYKNHGWRGINIDATPGSMRQFRIKRPRDVNLELGVGKVKKIVPFYCFPDSQLNSFDRNVIRAQPYTVVKVPIVPLRDILKKHVHRQIDLLTVDVEGLDYEVLQSNDWKVFSPLLVVVEDHNYPQSPIGAFLKKKGYKFVAKTGGTTMYQRLESTAS